MHLKMYFCDGKAELSAILFLNITYFTNHSNMLIWFRKHFLLLSMLKTVVLNVLLEICGNLIQVQKNSNYFRHLFSLKMLSLLIN